MKHPIEELSAYVDDELDAESRRLLETHLHQCEFCSAALNGIREIKSQVAGYFESVEPSVLFERNVMKAIGRSVPVRIGVQSGIFLTLAGFAFLAAFWLLFGPIAVKLLSTLYSFARASVYLGSSALASIPSAYGVFLAFSILLIMISGISLRRLFRSTIS